MMILSFNKRKRMDAAFNLRRWTGCPVKRRKVKVDRNTFRSVRRTKNNGCVDVRGPRFVRIREEIKHVALAHCFFQDSGRLFSDTRCIPLFSHEIEHVYYGFHRYSDEKLAFFYEGAGPFLQDIITAELVKRQAQELRDKHGSGESKQRGAL